MTENPYTGEVTIETAEGAISLRFSWRALGGLRHLLGKEWEVRLFEAISETDTETLAQVLALGSSKPEGWWLEQSPAFNPTMKALQAAIRLAYLGPEEPQENPQAARLLPTLLQRVMRHGRRPAGEPASSGA